MLKLINMNLKGLRGGSMWGSWGTSVESLRFCAIHFEDCLFLMPE